jgi:hypothetical protein
MQGANDFPGKGFRTNPSPLSVTSMTSVRCIIPLFRVILAPRPTVSLAKFPAQTQVPPLWPP